MTCLEFQYLPITVEKVTVVITTKDTLTARHGLRALKSARRSRMEGSAKFSYMSNNKMGARMDQLFSVCDNK